MSTFNLDRSDLVAHLSHHKFFLATYLLSCLAGQPDGHHTPLCMPDRNDPAIDAKITNYFL